MRRAHGVEGHEEVDNCIKSAWKREAVTAVVSLTEESEEPNLL